MKAIQLFSPAKVNLYLRVLGRRDDGFHDLLSLVCPLDFGDAMTMEIHDGDGRDRLECEHEGLPVDGSNLVLRAIELFRSRHPLAGSVVVHLEKNIPLGAGLGGGSSNAAATLWGLNHLAGHPFPVGELMEMSSELGSDCPLFLAGGACVLRGRGEQVEPLSTDQARRLEGQRLLLLLPGIHVSTPWAYSALARKNAPPPGSDAAEAGLGQYLDGRIPLGELLHNDFGPMVESKFVALAAARSMVEAAGLGSVLLSGSGSAMFALLDDQEGESGLSEAALRALQLELGGEFGLVRTGLRPFFPQPFKLRECAK